MVAPPSVNPFWTFPCGSTLNTTPPDGSTHCDSTAEIIKDHYGHLSGEELTTATAEENVLVQLEHLRTLPIIASRASRGIINLHGWMYKFETGEVFVYDSAVGQFAKLGEDNGLGIK